MRVRLREASAGIPNSVLANSVGVRITEVLLANVLKRFLEVANPGCVHIRARNPCGRLSLTGLFVGFTGIASEGSGVPGPGTKGLKLGGLSALANSCDINFLRTRSLGSDTMSPVGCRSDWTRLGTDRGVAPMWRDAGVNGISHSCRSGWT